MANASRFQPGDDARQQLISFSHQVRPFLTLLQGVWQRGFEKLVDAAQDGREGPARKPAVLLVQEPKRDEVRGLELEGVALFSSPRRLRHQRAIHPDDLEGLFFDVVCFLRVQRQDLVRHGWFGDHDGGDKLAPELLQDGAPVVTVGRPILAGLRRNDDDGVDEAIEFSNHFLQALYVRGREIPLVRRRLDAVHGQQAEQMPVIADGFLEHGQHMASVALNLLCQRADVARRLFIREGRPGGHGKIASRRRPQLPSRFIGVRHRETGGHTGACYYEGMRRPSRHSSLARVRKICLALPETSERPSHGAPTFFIRGKRAFVTYHDNHHGDGRLAIWCAAPPEIQRMLVASQPDRYFVPAYVGHLGWLGVRLDRDLGWSEIAGLIEDAYLTVAPKKLIEAARVNRHLVRS